jgi:hypothetical protein
MNPVTPVVKGQQHREIILAKDQPEYRDLPVLIWGKPIVYVSRWELTWKERWKLFWSGSIWIQQMTFGGKLQPQLPSVYEPHETEE